jgi:hypothetical protein
MRTAASIASHRNVRDDRDPPLIRGEMDGVKAVIWVKREVGIFFPGGLDGVFGDLPVGQSVAVIRPLIVRESGRSGIPLSEQNREASAYWIPAFAGMTHNNNVRNQPSDDQSASMKVFVLMRFLHANRSALHSKKL